MRQMAVPSFKAQQTGYKVYQRFRGLDLSTDQTQIDDSRSPKMVNMISDSGGYPEVRVGWRVLHSFEGGGKVGSIYPFTIDGVRQMIVHVGTRLVRLMKEEKAIHYTEKTLMTGLTEGLSQGFYFGGDLWILTGGEYIHYDGVGAKKVEEEAYVPTTSILRGSTGAKTNEAVNLLSPWRKNTFVTDGSNKSFTVDTGKIDKGSIVTAEYTDKNGKKVTIKSGDKVSGTTRDALTFDPETGKVTLDTAPPAPAAAGVATLTITFQKTTEGAADKIRKCRVFTTFGVNTGSRVFLAGNPDKPATEYYSGLNDPTYFPDNNFVNVGTSSFSIVNYLKYDGELLVIKEDNRQENTVWHHTAEIDAVTGKAIFPLREGVSGIGGCARFSCQTLRDDPLFLSPQGVYAPCLTYFEAARRKWGSRSFDGRIGRPVSHGVYADMLAGKKQLTDRSAEEQTGRPMYRAVSDVETKAAVNLTGFNIATALNNLVAMQQGGSEVSAKSMARAALNYARSLTGDGDFDARSTFLTNRHGTDRVWKTNLQKVQDIGSKPMEWVDHFTAGILTRGRYYDNVRAGLNAEQAMKEADDWAARVIGDRSVGARPQRRRKTDAV